MPGPGIRWTKQQAELTGRGRAALGGVKLPRQVRHAGAKIQMQTAVDAAFGLVLGKNAAASGWLSALRELRPDLFRPGLRKHGIPQVEFVPRFHPVPRL